MEKHKKIRTRKSNIKGRCSRRRTAKNAETIEVVRSYVENNTTNVSCRRNGLGLSHDVFNKIMKLDLTPESLTKVKDWRILFFSFFSQRCIRTLSSILDGNLFAKTVNNFKSINIFAKSSVSDAWCLRSYVRLRF